MPSKSLFLGSRFGCRNLPFLADATSSINKHSHSSICPSSTFHSWPVSTHREIVSLNLSLVVIQTSPVYRPSFLCTNPSLIPPEIAIYRRALVTLSTNRLRLKNLRGTLQAMLDIAPRPVAPAPSKVDHSIQEGRLNLSVTSDHPSSVELPPSQAKVETSPEAVSEQSAKKGVSTGPTPPPLLILDLNGCILYRQYVPGAAKIIKPRPHLDDLFEYISALHSKDDQTPNWEIMIWSSAQPRNVELMVEAIKLSRRPPVVRATRRRLAAQKGQLSDISNRLDALALNDSAPASNDDEAVKKPMKRTVMDVWDRDTLDLSSKDYGNKVATTKDLCKVWNQVSWTDPKTGDQLKWGAHNTIIVDDSPDKLSLQPDNLFLVDEFKGDPDDTAILKLMETLKSLRDEPNIPEALKKLKAKEAVA